MAQDRIEPALSFKSSLWPAWKADACYWECPAGHPLADFKGARCCASSGDTLFVVKPHGIGEDELFSLTLAATGINGELEWSAATKIELKAVDPPRTIGAMVVLPRLDRLPETKQLEEYRGKPLSESQIESIFDQYDLDGNGLLDNAELLQFWTDVVHNMDTFPEGTPDSFKDEAISQAVERTILEFDDLEKDGYVDRREFIEHMIKTGVVVPKNLGQLKISFAQFG